MSTLAIAHDYEREILDLYGERLPIDSIVGRVGKHQTIVREVISRLARFDRARARDLVAEYDKTMGKTPGAVSKPQLAELVAASRPPRPSAPPAPKPPTVTLRSAPGERSIQDLLDAATRTGAPKVVRLADRIRALVAELEPLVDAAEKEHAVLVEISTLRRQMDDKLEQLKKLRGNGPQPKPAEPGPTDKQIREWAKANQVDCPRTGRLPTPVRELYAKAHS